MKHVVILTLVALQVVASASPAPLTPAIRSIIDEYENAVRANTQRMIAAATEEERNRYRASIPSAGPYATQMLRLVQANLDHPEVVAGVSWLVTGAASFPEGREALTLLGTRFADRAGIAVALKQLEYHGLPVEPVLKAVLEKNPHTDEKAAALYALGAVHFKNFDASVDRSSAAVSKDQALACFQRLNAEFSDVSVQGFRLADLAAKMLFEMTSLQEGCPAPELEGLDADGKPMRLSDYRGKHVILVFWGGWCHACHGLLPQVNSVVDRLSDQETVVLGINTDIATEAKAMLASHQVKFRNLLDNTTSGPNATLYNLRNFPTLYLIDPKGKIVIKNGTFETILTRVVSR